MTNSCVEYLKDLYGAILKDCAAWYPDDRRGLERDHSRLLSYTDSRGISVFTLDLPALGKEFDRSLSRGHLTRSGLPLSRSARRADLIPRLFQGLYRRVFRKDGCLLDQPDPKAIFFIRTLLYTGKKWKMNCGVSKTVKAVNEFYQVDGELRLSSLNWEDPNFDPTQASALSLCDGAGPSFTEEGMPNEKIDASACPVHLLYDLQLVADVVCSELHEFNALDYSGKHGPGAVADQRRNGNKFLFPTWSARLERVFPLADVGLANYNCWIDAISKPDVPYGFNDVEEPSVLIAVPKTQKAPRLIAKESIANQWCQQSILNYLVKMVDRVSIGSCLSFDSQELSRDAARRASATESFATIDLSSASDRVSCWLVERLFRRNYSLLDALQASRTSSIRQSIDKKSPEVYQLRKFSTMGSAITFPLQSYIYAMICVSALLSQRGLTAIPSNIRKVAKEVLVFGDDIIIPVDVTGTVIAMLGHLGFKVNHDKSFWIGKFRESCGMDAFMGHDVTPAYITQPPQQDRPESMIASVELCKNFFKKSLYNAAEMIEKTSTKIPLLRLLPRVPVDSGAFGWPCVWHQLPPRKKWDAKLQRWLYWTAIPKVKQSTSATQGSTGLARYFYERPNPLYQWTSEIGLRPSLHLTARWEPMFGF